MKKALIDSSSAILLFKAGLFTKLGEIYSVMMVDAVYDELTRDGYPGAETFKECDVTLYQTSIENSRLADDVSLGRGEFHTIAGYLQGLGDFVLVDDGSAARYCKRTGIPFINALLIPKVLYLAGFLDEAEQRSKTEFLIDLGRYSRKVIEYAAGCTRHELEFFIP